MPQELPAGFMLDEPQGVMAELPEGFVLDNDPDAAPSHPMMQEQPSGFLDRAALRAAKEGLNPYEAFFAEARQSASDYIDKAPYAAEAAGALAATPASMKAAAAVMPFNPLLGIAIALGGTALGAMMGTAAENVIQPPETAEELFTEPLQTGAEDVQTGAAIMSVIPGGRMLGRGTYNAITRVASDAAKETAQAAERIGVNLTPLQATAREGVKGYTKVIGAFPIVGTPIRKAQEQVETALTSAFGKQLDKIGKAGSRFQVSEDMVKGAEKAYREFTADAGQLYSNWRKAARNASIKDIFPAKPIRDVAATIKQEMSKGKIEGVRELPKLDGFEGFIDDLSNLNGRLTIEQLEGQIKQINDFIKRGAAEGYDMARGIQLKKAFESAVDNPSLNLFGKEARREAAELKTLKDQADKFFSSGKKSFETSGAKIFGRVDKNIFSPKYEAAGTRAEDDIYKSALANRTPQRLKELRDVVGDEAFGNMTRYHLDDIYNKSFTVGEGNIKYFDPDKFKSALEIGTKEGDEILDVMLKGNKGARQALDDFVKAAEAVGSVTVRDPSTFVARRAVLGSIGGLAAISQPVKTAVLAGAGRYLSSILSDPVMTKAMQTAFDPNVTKQMQIRAGARLFQLLPMEDQERAYYTREMLGTNPSNIETSN